jgi:CBS domain-containing protein
MHRGLVTTSSATPIAEAASLLVANGVHALVVTARDGQPVGVLSDTDLLAGEWLATDDEGLAVMRGMTAGELISPEIETVDADEDAAAAAGRLRVRRLGRLVVLDCGEAVGVLSIADLVAGLARPPG